MVEALVREQLPNGENISSRLTGQKAKILDVWEHRVRSSVDAARQQEQAILRDSMPVFLDEIARSLATGEAPEPERAKAILAHDHGGQRAQETDYALDQLILEYCLLRKTTVEVLLEHGPLPERDREIVVDAIEAVMREAAAEFAREQRQALQSENERKNDFLAMLAHEIRTPLSAVANALYILENIQLSDERAVRQLLTANRQTRQLARLAEDLLDINRIARGTIELRREMVELGHVAQEAAEAHRELMEGRGQDFRCFITEETLLVNADPARLDQILTNLLGNAAKFTEPGGTIWLVVERDQDQAVMRVHDTGPGIEPILLPQIFDMFRQVQTSRAAARGGLGIGLALVKRLVELHGGSVAAHSAGKGQGTEFVVRLPLHSGSAAPSAQPCFDPAS